MNEAKELLQDVTWCSNAYDAIENTDALAILTEWNEFRALDLGKLRSIMKQPIMIDLRNIYNPNEMKIAGFEYFCIGR